MENAGKGVRAEDDRGLHVWCQLGTTFLLTFGPSLLPFDQAEAVCGEFGHEPNHFACKVLIHRLHHLELEIRITRSCEDHGPDHGADGHATAPKLLTNRQVELHSDRAVI